MTLSAGVHPIRLAYRSLRTSFSKVSGFSAGDAPILSDVSLAAPAGSVTCLLGPSGSGKTTLLRIAAGMERPSAGRVLRDGVELCGPTVMVAPEKRGIGLVFQDYALFPHLTIGQNVAFGLAHLKRGDRRPQALHMLQRVGLKDRERRLSASAFWWRTAARSAGPRARAATGYLVDGRTFLRPR